MVATPSGKGPGSPGENGAGGRISLPRVVFDAPLFRGFDARAEREIEAASQIRDLGRGDVLYSGGDDGESFFIVASGRIAILARRRGEDSESVIRVVGPGESFGEEAVAAAKRRGSATAEENARVAEIPVHIFRRAAARSGKAELAERLERTMRRSAARDLLRTATLTRDLSDELFDTVLDAATWRTVARGESVYRPGDPAEYLYLVADGRVQVQTEDGVRLRVRGYLGEGDFFGDEEIALGNARTAAAVASGPSTLLAIPAAVIRDLARRDPERFQRLRRVATAEDARKRFLIEGAAANATQHVFRDLYRLEIARSLLVIDLESCVRCGHCTWTCGSLHGTPRLIRRGDKIVTRRDPTPGALFQGSLSEHLMLPSSCQHCENPACMVDCPTGAIAKDARGEVFIREELCTGCGACARACPWDNIQIAPRPGAKAKVVGQGAAARSSLPGSSSEIAVKCDLCSAYASGPGCVEACPTAAISRIDPSEDLTELRQLLGRGKKADGERTLPISTLWIASAALCSLAIGSVGLVMQSRKLFGPSYGIGYGAGVASAIGFALLLGYSVPKRGAKLWKRKTAIAPKSKEDVSRRTRSITRPQLVAHVAIGMVATALALVHAPLTFRGTTPQTLLVSFLAASLVGLVTALLYVVVPRRLARIERTALLPEDFREERQALHDRLFRGVTGKSELVKKLAERVLLPYSRNPLGPLLLLANGRDLRGEQKELRKRVDTILEGRGGERLAGVDDLIRIVVEIRALPAQRWLVRLLRVGLPMHVVCFSVAAVLIVAHVVLGVGR